MQLVVARVGRAHGIKGELTVEVRTDAPGARFVPGVALATDPPERGPLVVTGARDHNGTLLLTFDQVSDRSAAEALRGTLLLADVDADGADEADAWYAHRLVGLRAVTLDGRDVGEVVGLEHLPAQDLLVIRNVDGRDVLVPFVTAIVPEVDIEGGRVVLDPPGGLFDPPGGLFNPAGEPMGRRSDGGV